ncbi:MAG TPA: hypothetical protein VK065_05780 [Brevibacterium sp.]|nr:hypothetical protein [Brevibacterium sp.]
MNIGTRLLLSAALAVGSTVGAAALGQNVARDAQAELGQAAPCAIPAPAAPQDDAAADCGDAGEGAGERADVEADADVRADGVRAELAAAAAAGEISWDAAERVSDELGGYIRGDRVLDDIA